MMRFYNTEAIQAGKSIQELERRQRITQEQYASRCNLSLEYFRRLEEGLEDTVYEETIERILKMGGIEYRYGKNNGEELKRLLLSIRPPVPMFSMDELIEQKIRQC
jgi:transcriptional regulator with XRE-family HTH domain